MATAAADDPLTRISRAQERRCLEKKRHRARAAAKSASTSSSSSAAFCSQAWMLGRPSCAAAAFATPRLRQCPFDLAAIDWQRSARMACGVDGHLWKVWFKGSGPYVLKVFWDTSSAATRYFAAKRECQNAALLQMMQAAVEASMSESAPPICVNPCPKTRGEARENTLAFSEEGRRGELAGQAAAADGGTTTMQITSVPRLRKCYGWAKVHGHTLWNTWPATMRPRALRLKKFTRSFSDTQEYLAIVYEYVEEAENDAAAVERAADFFWRAGFGYTLSSAERNWKSGVLVDLSDIVHASSRHWNEKGYGTRSAARILRP
ncbi:hypothetical protein F5X98DRAFT_359569 [Xylaria grammica]|nr:hypothetical protein F5X98DRAFT_359569 [Xylaria grammica]